MSAFPDKKPGAAASAPDPRKLPKDYDTRFSQLITCYEKKEYKRGIKLADEILKKFPNHGETQAMKGLVLNCQDSKEAAHEWVKLGLKNDIRSHVCWHVFGLIHRSDSNYKEASKCYMNALRINPNNQNILRDLSWLHIQLRDYEAFVGSRRKILESKPALRTNWVALAMAHYESGEYAAAFTVIQECNKVHKAQDDKDIDAYDQSEFLLFQNRCLEMQGLYQEAVSHLGSILPSVTDKLSCHVKTAELLTLLGQYPEARAKWLFLLKDQPENYRYHTGLQVSILELPQELCKEMFALKSLDLPSSVLQLTPAQRTALQQVYASEAALNMRASQTTMRKIGFTLLQGDALRESLRQHIKTCIQKGIPALYQDVVSLVTVDEVSSDSSSSGSGSGSSSGSSSSQGEVKAGAGGLRRMLCKEPMDFNAHPLVRQVREWMEAWIRNLRASSTFEGEGAGAASESPQCLLWALFLQSDLLERSGEIEKALLYINECIAHTPTATDMYLRKAKLLKKMGDIDSAAQVANEGRALDLQDRYLNNKATKYAFRANKVSEANELMAMFARHEGDPQMYLAEMQCNWYELEAAEALARKKQWGGSLKKYYSILKHFDDYGEDMFDFHGFCVRKSSLRAHASAMSLYDKACTHPFFQRACRGALEIFVHLLDDPEDVDGFGHLNPKDRKKEREKRKKQRARDQKAEEARVAAAEEEAKRFGSAVDKHQPKLDADPDGEKYLTRNFLDEANNWAAKLVNHYHSCDPAVLALVSEIHLRRSKPLQAVRALSVGLRKHPEHPALTPALLRLHMRLTTKLTKSQKCMSQTPLVIQATKAEFSKPWMFGTGSAGEFVDRLLVSARQGGSSGSSLKQREAAAQCKMFVEQGSDAAKEVVRSLLDTEDFCSIRGANVKTAEKVVRRVQTAFGMSDLADSLRARTKLAYPAANFGALRIAGEAEAEGEELEKATAEVEELP